MAITKTPVTIGALELAIAPLTVGQLRRLTNDGTLATLASLQAGSPPTTQQFDAMLAVVVAGLTRCQDVDAEQVADNLEMAQLADLLPMLMGRSGLSAGEATPRP